MSKFILPEFVLVLKMQLIRPFLVMPNIVSFEISYSIAATVDWNKSSLVFSFFCPFHSLVAFLQLGVFLNNKKKTYLDDFVADKYIFFDLPCLIYH